MKIEIDDDCADMVVQESLVQTYKDLSTDLKLYKKGQKQIHEEDVEIYKRVVEALKVVGNWYFAYGEFEKRVKKK
jgi:hypothetical protein